MCGVMISTIHCNGNPQYEQKDDSSKRFIDKVNEWYLEDRMVC